MAKNESSKSKAELYREERKERLAKAAKKNAKNVKSRTVALEIGKKAAAILVAVAIVAGIGWAIVDHFGVVEKFSTAITVGDEKVSVAQYNYYYSMAYQYYAQMESTYQQQGMSMGFPLDKAPDEVSTNQKDEDGNIVYYDTAIANYASNLAFQQLALYTDAVAEGYKINEEEQKQIDEAIASISEQAKKNSYSLNAFIRANYSKGLNEKSLRQLLEMELIASRYNEDIQKKAHETVTDEQVEKKYKEDPKTYNYADIRSYTISFDTLTKASAETEEEFTKRKNEANQPKIDAAKAMLEKFTDAETFKTAALEHKNSGLKEGTKPTEVDPTVENKGATFAALKTSLSEDAAKWIFDSARKIGDKNVFTTDKAAIVVLIGNPAYEGVSADVRHCLIKFDVKKEGDKPTDEIKQAASKKANEVKDEWLKAGGTEDAFKAIVKKYNDDTASTENGGLYEDIRPNSNYVASFKNWAIDPARKTGDCEIVETEYGYHIMYYVKSNGPDWKLTVREAIQEEVYGDAFEAIIGEEGKYKMVEDKENIAKVSKEFCDKIRLNLAQQAAA